MYTLSSAHMTVCSCECSNQTTNVYIAGLE